MHPEYILLDFETTGLDPRSSEIIEIGAIHVRGFEVLARYETLVKPQGELPAPIARLTGINAEMLSTARSLSEVLAEFREFLGFLPIVAHNSSLEQGFLDQHVGEGYVVHNSIDPLALLLPDHPSHSMESMRGWAGVDGENSHRAFKDCEDLLKVLQHAHQWMAANRPQIGEIACELMPTEELFWWRWFFGANRAGLLEAESMSVDWLKLLRRPHQGDLRELKSQDSAREIDWSGSVPEPLLLEALHGERAAALGSSPAGFERRESQEKMALEVRSALVKGERVAIEAPTGTGKSVAYLLPGILAARSAGVPLVVSTHSKSLQDQLLEKDIPLVQKLMGEPRPLRAVTVKGQDNYLCLRKTMDAIADVDETSTADERYAIAYIASFASLGQVVELDRISHYVRIQHPALGVLIDQLRSHRTTTIGPTCPYYSSCHFFDSARLAHQAEVVIANHALVFQWPAHLPQIRTVVFDEAHHLEDRITESFAVRLSEGEMNSGLDRLTRRGHGKGHPADATLIARLFDTLVHGADFPKHFAELDPLDMLNGLSEEVRSRLVQIKSVLPLAITHRDGSDGYDQTIQLADPKLPAREQVMDAVSNLGRACEALAAYLTAGVEAYQARGKRPQKDSTYDALVTHASRFEGFASALEYLRDTNADAGAANQAGTAPPVVTDFIRLIFWQDREQAWRLYVAPIDVSTLSEAFFSSKRAVVLASATLSTGVSGTFVTDRIGLKLSRRLLQLPSPYQLEKQARVYIPNDVAQPGTPSHLEALVGFTEQMATQLEGRTLLLLSSNRRLKIAADVLRQRLEPRGITVLDSLTDRKAAEIFKQTERAVLVGGERYGEGLDIPGASLSCVIIEKINEAMTRGPLAEARKAKTRFALYDYDFPLRMMWLKQRVGRLIRGPGDTGCVVVFDPRFTTWSQSSRKHVVQALAPMPIKAATREEILMEVEREFKPGEGFSRNE